MRDWPEVWWWKVRVWPEVWWWKVREWPVAIGQTEMGQDDFSFKPMISLSDQSSATM